ncbi:MAG: 2-oxo acid dehydrogenase subunit E2 [Ignavibacteriales bacterium]|nr:MAG: 2-oxoglutarate dehydrogenase [Ignavibacteriaceae bacterium]MBV6445436.1 hypothetical protein [Ignavibacteriaceae bacterium]MBW7872416.1 2-oxo acid dehydrogenase subunit E2 [Ignavibacteria bacterium]MCZ2143635.1 2-oxo acid dehydrogenase subunit E2 [Ignavibacteriales bacterium]WKZ73157.1 MAG: 2-oxo acid dehydrogenase subunit E2 [Ignavibacteriaceae bacterium]
MNIDILMPKMGESVTEGTVIKWHKKPGDKVAKDEIIFEISTDKVDTEIPSPEEGFLSEILVQEQETVAVGVVVARLSVGADASAEAPVRSAPAPESGSVAASTAAVPADEGSGTTDLFGGAQQQTTTTTATAPEPVAPTVETPAVSAPAASAPTEGTPPEPAALAPAGGNVIDIPMPKMGESVMEGTIIKWHKQVGEPVKLDETFFEISTDKVDTEITSPADGVVAEILVNEQETVSVGTIVARLSTSGGAVQAQSGAAVTSPVAQPEVATSVAATGSAQAAPSMHDVVAQNAAGSAEAMAGSAYTPAVPSAGSSGEAPTGDKFFSPLVMNIARKEGISISELESINGTGIGGRVTKNDVLSYLQNRSKAPAQAAPQPATPSAPVSAPAPATPVTPAYTAPATSQTAPSASVAAIPVSQPSVKPQFTFSGGDVEITPMDNIRRKIMEHMVHSRDTAVHVAGLVEVDMSRVQRYIAQHRAEIERTEGVKLTYMSFISHAVIRALREYPLVNSTIEGDKIITKKFVNLGIAVAVQPNGLIVPNIKNAQDKNIVGLAKAVNDVAVRARNRKLTPDDITNGTFSITNYGVFGTLFGTPIINQPEVAILGVGAVVKRAVVVEIDGTDTIAIKPMMYLTLSHDHRLVDGMLGGLFLKAIKENLENLNDNLIY